MAAQGERTLVLAHRRADRDGPPCALLPELPEVCFVEVGDFTGAARAPPPSSDGLTGVVFVGMAGKLTKLAAGVLMTHYTRSKVDLVPARHGHRRGRRRRRPGGGGGGGQHRPARVRAVGGRRAAATRR